MKPVGTPKTCGKIYLSAFLMCLELSAFTIDNFE